VLLIYM